MTTMKVIHITSVDQLRQVAFAWDDLWWRSNTTIPTARAAFIAQWLEQFAPNKKFHAIVIENNGNFVAALPLVRATKKKFLRTAAFPTNAWSPSGELLLDEQQNVNPILDALVAAFRRLPWKWLWLDTVLPETVRWQALADALNRAGMRFARRQRYRVAWASMGECYETLRKSWSKNFRRNITRSLRRLEEDGELRLRIETPSVDDVKALITSGFEIEDRSWKGKSGSSILRSPGMAEFYRRQAEQLAEFGQLILAFLDFDGQPIAFEYGWGAKGVYHSFKIGYDEQFASASPGQLLLYKLLERFHETGEFQAIDFLGPINLAAERFRLESYHVGQMLITTGGLLNRALLVGYKHVWPRLARRQSQEESSAVDAASPIPDTKVAAK